MGKRRIFPLAVLCIPAILIFLSCMDFIPPEDMTTTAIGETFFRIHLYAKSKGVLVERLIDLPERSGYGNRLTDGWGRALLFELNEDGILTLQSLGEDGLAGGVGSNCDIVCRYRTRDESGRFIVSDDLWIVTGEVK